MDQGRLAEILATEGLLPPLSIPPSRLQQYLGLGVVSVQEEVRAREILTLARRCEIERKGLVAGRRQRFLTLLKRASFLGPRGEQTWIFSKHEVAKAFDQILSQSPLIETGIAQAVLAHANFTELDELWWHLHDDKPEKKTFKSRFRRSSSSLGFAPGNTWLQRAAELDDADYVRLLCQVKPSKDALKQAFGIALKSRSIGVMQVLLEYGAQISVYRQRFQDYISSADEGIVKLLLAFPKAIDAETWLFILRPHLEPSTRSEEWNPGILLLCISHRPDIVSPSMVLDALVKHDFQVLVICQAYAPQISPPRASAEDAFKSASTIESSIRKVKVFSFLEEWNLFNDSEQLREELLKSVQARDLLLIQLFVSAGVCLDMEPHASARWAVQHMDFEVLEIMIHGSFSGDVSRLLEDVPDSTSEDVMLRFMLLFRTRNLEGEPLHKHLLRAVKRHEIRLATLMIECGASAEYDDARAFHIALSDTSMLSVLLKGPCAPELSSSLVLELTSMKPGPERLSRVKELLEKGSVKDMLQKPLTALVSADEDTDNELIQLLLDHHAPTGSQDSTDPIPLDIAIRKGRLPVVTMLSKAETSVQVVSEALLVAINARYTNGHGLTLSIVNILCESGACGSPLDEAFVASLWFPDGLDIVQILLEYGADANSQLGISFEIAVKSPDPKLLPLLCELCPPTSNTLIMTLPTVLNLDHYNSQTLSLLLSADRIGEEVVDMAWDMAKHPRHAKLNEIISVLILHGLSVDKDNGSLLRHAVKSSKMKLLKSLLAKSPKESSLKVAFQAAMRLGDSPNKLAFMRALLDQAGSRELGQSECLEMETIAALAGDDSCFRLLLEYRADVNHDDGSAVSVAASNGSLPVLQSLLECKPTPRTLTRACLSTESSLLDDHSKHEILRILLTHGGYVTETEKNSLLAEAIEKWPQGSSIVRTLLYLRTPLSLNALLALINFASRSLFVMLLESVTESKLVAGAFVAIRRMDTLTTKRRLWMSEYLLSRDLPKKRVSQALLETIEKDDLKDLSLVKLLLDHNASIDYHNGSVFKAALKVNSVVAVQLLSKYTCKKCTAEEVFRFAVEEASLEPQLRYEIYRCMLRRNLDASLVYRALLEHLESDRIGPALVPLLLQYGANPNRDRGRCFVVAATAGSVTHFKTLCQGARIELVVRALIEALAREDLAIYWIRILINERPSKPRFNDHGLLRLTMDRFPRGAQIMKLILDLIIPAPEPIECIIPGTERTELCTIVIWALLQQTRVDNEVILALLKCHGLEALPSFVTPETEIFAAFLCLLDPVRTPVLEALLSLDRDRILNQIIPGSTFGMLATHPQQCKSDPESLELRAAALYLGNLTAFQAITGRGSSVAEGTLHVASMLALPGFVAWLLTLGFDPNTPNDEMEQPWIPLALACISREQPWCKVANSISDISKRRSTTMQILAKVTDRDWRCNHRTVLHIALENGPEVTRSMIDALDVKQDSDRNERYLYVDRGGIEYSPDMYVKYCMGLEEAKKKSLIYALKDAKFQSRHFRRVMPGEGDQPANACGLPSGYKEAWEANSAAYFPLRRERDSDVWTLDY